MILFNSQCVLLNRSSVIIIQAFHIEACAINEITFFCCCFVSVATSSHTLTVLDVRVCGEVQITHLICYTNTDYKSVFLKQWQIFLFFFFTAGISGLFISLAALHQNTLSLYLL